MTRTDAILRALIDELEPFRGLFDASGQLAGVQITLKLNPGEVHVRAVLVSPQFDVRLTPREKHS